MLSSDGQSAVDANGVSRVILGLQVGLVAISVFVTRSSVSSLKAKQGLPLGTQVAGWTTLGKHCFVFPSLQMLLALSTV